MTMETDTRDRVIRMEAELKSLKEDVEEMGKKVDNIHTLLTEARGAQKIVKFFIWLSGKSVFIWFVTYYKAIMGLLKG